MKVNERKMNEREDENEGRMEETQNEGKKESE